MDKGWHLYMAIERDDLKIEFPDNSHTYLNLRLVREKNLSMETVIKIKQKHLEVYNLVKALEKEQCPVVLKDLVNKWTKLQFELQKLWGFEQNPDFHRFWDLPKCTCPKIDNEDLYGMNFSIKNLKCILHGN